MDKVPLRYPGDYPVFSIGGSAGAVPAFQEIVAGLPDDFPATIFLVLHRPQDSHRERTDILPEILSKATSLPVEEAKDGELIRSKRIYVISEGLHVVASDNHLVRQAEPQDSHWRPSIDVFFKSVAREFQHRTVNILLTGMLEDGVEGLIETTFNGGITVAQSPSDAYAPDLPLNAILNDHPSYVLPVRDLPKLLCELCRFSYFPDQKEVTEHAAATALILEDHLKN